MLSDKQFQELNIEHFGERPHEMPLREPRGGERTHIGSDTPLWTTQRTFDPRTVESYRDVGSSHPISVWEDQGDHFIMDGHHRVIAARQSGRDIPAKIYRSH